MEALLLVDIQKDYFPGGNMPLVGADEAAAKAASVLAAFRGAGLPVIHVRHEAARPGATFFLPGTTGTEIHPAVAPLPGEAVVLKHFPNSFRETGLGFLLDEGRIERLTVCGMMTHMCVDAGVRAAMDLGLSCSVVHDACATRNLEFEGVAAPAAQVQAAFLAALFAAGAGMAPAAEVARTIGASVGPAPTN